MDTAWTWELSGYCAKYSFLTEPKGLMQIVTATGQRGLNSGPVRAMDSGQLRT